MAREREAAREAAFAEARVARLLELLGPVLEDTKSNIEKKQARTYEEMQAELTEADQVLLLPRTVAQQLPPAASLACQAAAAHGQKAW